MKFMQEGLIFPEKDALLASLHFAIKNNINRTYLIGKRKHCTIDLEQIKLIVEYIKPTTTLKNLCLNLLNSEKCTIIIHKLYESKTNLFGQGQVLPIDIENILLPPTQKRIAGNYNDDLNDDEDTFQYKDLSSNCYYDDEIYYASDVGESEFDVDIDMDIESANGQF